MWTQQSPASIKLTIFDEMRKLGVDYLEAYYSGGNDEGGIDDVHLFRRAAPRKRKNVEARPVAGTLTKVEKIELPGPVKYLDYDHPLHEALDELLSIDFGSFAGEFNAHGVIFADIPSGRVWREGEVSSYSYDESGGEW